MKNETSLPNTKNKIEQKFIELVSKKPLAKVTVSEIIKECGINRKTFYYYFEDIYALLKWTMCHEAINIVENFNFLTEVDEIVKFVVNYIYNNKSFLKNVYYSVGRDELKRFLYDDFETVVKKIFEARKDKNTSGEDIDFQKFSIKFYTEAVASTLVDLIVGRNDTDKYKTAEYLSKIIKNSV